MATGRLVNEIDEVAWLDVRTAHDRLDYARDREQLLALVRADAAGRAAHLAAGGRPPRQGRARAARGRGDDRQRPLDAVGRAQAPPSSPVLGAYGVTRVVTSPLDPLRRHRRAVCRRAPGCALRTRDGAVRGGVRRGAPRGRRRPAAAAARARRAGRAVQPRSGAARPCSGGCTPGSRTRAERGRIVAEHAARGRGRAMAKGEVLVCHVVGRGEDARVVDVERIDT